MQVFQKLANGFPFFLIEYQQISSLNKGDISASIEQNVHRKYKSITVTPVIERLESLARLSSKRVMIFGHSTRVLWRNDAVKTRVKFFYRMTQLESHSLTTVRFMFANSPNI